MYPDNVLRSRSGERVREESLAEEGDKAAGREERERERERRV